MIYESPFANKKPLLQKELEPDLIAYRCEETGGHYLPFQNYWKWLGKQQCSFENIPVLEMASKIIEEEQVAKLCPETRTLMPAFEVGRGFRFRINRSVTGGIWFDAGEWEEIRSRNFHDEIHLIFSEPWQKQIRSEKLSNTYQEAIQQRLGKNLFKELQNLKAQLNDHPDKESALAFLHSEI